MYEIFLIHWFYVINKLSFVFLQIHRMLPWFEFFFIEPVEQNNIIFDTETNLMNTKMPILILHARDDVVIPYKLGEKVKRIKC